MGGLARFGHLINADVVQDLLELLRDLATRDALPLAAGLRCVQAAVAIMTVSARHEGAGAMPPGADMPPLLRPAMCMCMCVCVPGHRVPAASCVPTTRTL